MIAFMKVDSTLIKAYNQGEDWQLLSNTNNEFWFSVWQSDKKASLVRAFESTCERLNLTFSIDSIQFVIGV